MMTSSSDLLLIFQYFFRPLHFVHVFEAKFWSLSILQSVSNLHPMKTHTQNIFQIDAVIMTSSRDLLCIFEYLIFPIGFVHRFQGVISSASRLLSVSKLYQAQMVRQRLKQKSDVVMTSSCELFSNFKSLFFPIGFVHIFETAISTKLYVRSG